MEKSDKIIRMIENKNVRYLVYVDILGFDELAKEIEENENIKAVKVRDEILKEPIKTELERLKNEGKLYGYEQDRDEWILVLEDFDFIFEVVSRILRIEMPVGEHVAKLTKDYGDIPLEIAIGHYEFDKWAKLEGDKISCNDEVIKFLKTYILPEYRKKYENKNLFKIKESFILCTDSFFEVLKERHVKNYFIGDKDIFTYEDKEGNEKTYYLLNKEKVITEGKIPDFLNKIGQSRSDYSGALIDRIFVPPDEYNEIKKKLKEDRIVFMTGTAGYGKTYTAIRLLWEWYNRSYTPRWISGKEIDDRKIVREKLANIDLELKPKHMIYFEDPFGKTKYERRDDLKERINHIINSVRNKKDVFVVITSRKDVFEEFKKECYLVEEINEFKELSYDYEKRREILEKWAEEKGCKWFKDENLKEVVFESLKKTINLPTSLSIHDFTEKTIKTENEKELRREIDKYSQASEIAFADEIKKLPEDRILFLSFPFIFEYFEINFIKEKYKSIAKSLDIKYPVDFDEILKIESRVDKHTLLFDEEIYLKFVHPSYSEAIPYVLDEPMANKIFQQVLLKLSKDENSNVRREVADAVARTFDKLPEEFSEKILKELSKGENPSLRWQVADAVANNFDKIPEEFSGKILKELSKDENPGVRSRVADAVSDNFDKITVEVQNLLDGPQNELESKIEKLLESEHYQDRENAVNLISNVKSKLRKEFAIKILTKLSEDEDERVRQKAISALKQFQ